MFSEEYKGLELSTQILINSAKERGYEVDVLDVKDNFIRIRKDGISEYIKQASRTSADTYIAPLIMENKEVTKIVLREQGFHVPSGITVSSPEAAEMEFASLRGQDIVVKPKSTNFGQGISILKDVAELDVLMQAVHYAFQFDDEVMIEEFISGREYRFLVIGEETVAVLFRVPANVRGDGVHTIEQLVEEKNKDPRRGEGHVTPLEKIKLDEIEREYLRAQGKDIHTVPAKDEVVYLRENSNISTGGDSIDATDEMPAFYKDIAVKAAHAVGAKICGADIIVPDLAAPQGQERYSIIELNFNPAMHMHIHPYQGENRRVELKVLDLLEKLRG